MALFDSMFPSTGLWGRDIGNGSFYRGSPEQITNAERQAASKAAQDEAAVRRARELDDRAFEVELKKLKQDAERIAITRGQAEANRWYQEQSVKLAKRKLEEEARQFDLTFGEGKRQFNITASGYMDDGRNTLARDQFQDNSLFNWTKEAIQLASRPEDWVKLRRMQSGVAANIGSMPGLNWASGGQQGNTTFVGQPQNNSLGNVMRPMGINVGQGAGAGQQTAQSGNWASQAAQQADNIAQADPNFTPDEQQVYQTAREFAMNPQGAAPGWFENLDPLTRSLLQGAAEAQGLDWGSALTRHKRSRFGGGGSAMAA